MSGTDELESWLNELEERKPDTINFSFPTDALKAEYLSKIEERSDSDIRKLLRRFLIPSTTLGTDQLTLAWLKQRIKNKEIIRFAEFQRRLLIYSQAQKRGLEAASPWEGITWVLDLLSGNPRAALDTLNAYFEAHAVFMPDGRIHGFLTRWKSFAQNTSSVRRR